MTTMQIAHKRSFSRKLRTEEITEIAKACGDSQGIRNNEGRYVETEM
jgi:hypothetical protein